VSSIKAKAKISLVAILSIFSILTFGYLLNTGKSQAGWLSGWSYRIPITITEQSGNVLTDYQVLVTLDTASLISAGKMRSDCGDVRFTDSDGTTLLNYWLEGGCNSTNTKIWVKVPNIPANSSKIIYVYYGNPSATSASNGDATFDFFDDFIGTSLDTSKWTLGYASYEGASVTVSNGLALIKSISGDFEAIHSNYVIFNTDTKVIEAKTKILSTDIEPHFFFLVSSDNADSVRFGLREDYLDTAGNVIIVQFKAYGSYGYGYLYYDVGNEWFIARITKFDIGSFEGRVMDLNYNTLGNSFGAGTSDWENYNWWIGVFVRDSYGFYWDWVRVRKYTNPEPTILLGSEETAGGPTPSPPGWLSGWSYRIPITIGNTQNPNTLTDYQVLVVLDTQSLISQGKMRSDCGDIRFTDSDGQILLSYWIEPGCNSPNTRIWVKVPNIPASSTKTIYIYYGNPSATSQSDGYSTFLAFNLLFDGPIGGRNSMGGIHTCVLLSDGTAKCWGWNYFGQLGDGTTTDRYTPVNVSGLTNAVAIAAGYGHTCALLSDGTAKCWGGNFYGQLGDGTTTDRYTPVNVSGLTNAVAIVTGYGHTCALLSDGTAKCWGRNGYGQLGDGTTANRYTPVNVSGLTNAVAIAAGFYHTCALLSDGTAKCWGWNYYGQLGDGTTTDRYTPVNVSGLTNAVAIAAGHYHTCALLSDGTAKCWGWNYYGQLGDGTTTDRYTPVNVSGLTNAVAIAAGYGHTCALLSDGTAKCWGRNDYGQLGDGTTTDRYTPVNVSGLTNAVAIAVGDYHTCALLSDGTAKCWGRNDHGRLGDGTTENRYTPVSVLNYNFGGRYDKTNGIWTIQKPPYFMDTYFVRAYTDPEPTTILGSEETPPAPLGPNISSCGQITQPGSYVLVSDLQLPSGQPYCIKISSSDVEIDCQGHKIVDNSGNPNSTAILIDGYNDRITISNCIIEGFKVGIGAYDDVSRIYTYYNVFNNSEYAVWFNSVWVFNLKFSSLYNSRIYIIGDNVEIEYSNFTYVNTNADSIFGVYNYGFGNNYINITNYNYNSPMLVRFFINDSRFVYIYDNVIHISNTSYVEPYVNDSTFLIVISGEYIRHYYINGNQIYAKYPNGGSVVFDSSTGLVENVDIFDNYIESTGRYCLQIGRGYGFYVKYNTILDGCILLVGYTGQANYNFIHDNMISSFAILGNNNNIYYIYSSNNIIWGNMTKAPGAKILYLDSLYGTKLYGNTIYHPEYEVWGPEFIETYETFVSVVFGLNLVGFNQTTMEKLIKKEIPYAEIKIPMNISTNRIDYKIVINSTDLVNGEYYIPRSVFDFWIETTDGYKFANVGYENVFTILKQDINASYYFDLRMTNNIPIVPPGTYVGNVTIDIYAGELAENQFVDVDIGGVNVEIV